MTTQGKVAQCRFFGTFAPSSFLRAEFLANQEEVEQLKEKLGQSLTCFSPSTELTAFDLLDAENT